MKEHEKGYQVGNIVTITKEPSKARRNGFELGTEHAVIEPPHGNLNCGMGVWVMSKLGQKKFLRFFEYHWGGKKLKRIRNSPVIVRRVRNL